MMKARDDNDDNKVIGSIAMLSFVASVAMLSLLRASHSCPCPERRDLVLVAVFVLLSL